MKKTVEHTTIEIVGHQVPLAIHQEMRKNSRASIGKKEVIMRIPIWLTPSQKKESIASLEKWTIEHLSKNPEIAQRLAGKNYRDGDIIQVGERTYTLQIELVDKKSHSARMRPGRVIELSMSKGESAKGLKKSIRTLLSRVIAQDYKPAITRRVVELNHLYFQKPIKSVNLKYNTSNWGSCSTKGNVNLSTRLLFAPSEVIDYVIIHELAHLLEMNHSPRFWKLVSDAMPNYKEQEKWLKENRNLCEF